VFPHCENDWFTFTNILDQTAVASCYDCDDGFGVWWYDGEDLGVCVECTGTGNWVDCTDCEIDEEGDPVDCTECDTSLGPNLLNEIIGNSPAHEC